MGIPVDMVSPKTEHSNDKNKNNEDREEGEIVDDFEDIISSDEEFSMRERIKELEARNLELEKIASISGIYSYDVGYTKERYKSPISPPDLSKDDYYASAPKTKHNRPNPKASSKQSTTAIKRSKSSTRQHAKSGRRRSVSPPPKTMPLVSSRTRNRKRKYQKISRSRSSKRIAKSKKKTDLIDISSSEDELCALNRDELKKALKRDVKTFHHTKKNSKNTTIQKSAICDNIVSIIDLVDDEDDVDNKDELSDDSVTLEEQELRLIALKSAVFKKHLDRKRKKENEEAKPYSPSEFVELFGTFRGSPSSKNSIESGPMDISPITSPEYLSDNNNKPIDMDLVNSSDSECPIFAGQTDNWIPIDQIPLPNNNQKIPLQSPIPIKVTLATDSNDMETNYENDERVKIITVSNSPEPADEEELALRALLLAKMNSPKVSKNNNKPKDDVQVESNQCYRNFDDKNDYIKIDEPINNDSDTSLNAEILRNILLISLDKKPFSKTEQVLKEAVKRLKNQTQINKSDLFVSEGSDLQENSNSNDFNNPFPSDMDYRIQNNSTNCSVDQEEFMESDQTILDAKENRRTDKGTSDNLREHLPLKSSNINIENNKKDTNDQMLQGQIDQVDPVIPQLQILQLENIPIIEEDLNAQNKINVNIQISQASSSGVLKNETKINKKDFYQGEGSDLHENSDSSGCNNPFPSDIDYRIKSNSTNCSVKKSQVMKSDKALLDGKEANRNISDNFVEQISLKSSNYLVEKNKENKVVQSEIDQVSVTPQKINLFAQDLIENSPIIQENLNLENKNDLIIQKLQAGPSGDLVPNTTHIDVETTKGKGNLNVRSPRISPANISKTHKILEKSKIIKSTTKYASKSSHHISQQKRKALVKEGVDSTLPDNFKSISNSPLEDVFKKKKSRLITIADVPTVKQIIIHLGESESDTDDFESAFTTATTPTTFEDYCDKTSTKDVKLASPCDSPQNALSPAAVAAIDDTTGDSEVIEEKSSTKKCIVNDVFQARLNEFLKNARTKVEMIKKDPETPSTPLAVRHLPPSSQLEYKRLVNRMKILEKQKQAKNDKITGNIENFKVTIKNDVIKNKTDSAQIANIKRTIINDGVPTSVITFTEINPKDPLIKKVLIKNASNPQISYNADMKEISHSKENTLIYPTTSKNSRLKRRSISEGTQTERSLQLQDNTETISTVPRLDNLDLLQNYETDFTINSSSLLENISKTINLVHIAKGEKLKKFALQSKLEQLKKQMQSVEMEISNQTDRILKIYPKISESHKVIVNLKQKCMKLDKLSVNLGKAVNGKIYKTNEGVKRAIAEKSKLLSDEIKSLKGLKLNDYIKSMSAENDMGSLTNSPPIGVSSNEIAIEGCNVNISNCEVTDKINNSNSDIKDCDKETGITDGANIGTASCSKTDAAEESKILNETSLNITSTNSAVEIDIIEDTKKIPLHVHALPEISSNKLSEQNPVCEYKSMEDDTKDLKAEIVPESLQDKTELKQYERIILDTSLQTEESVNVQKVATGNTATIFNITDNIGNDADTDMISISEENTLETLTSPNPRSDICIGNSSKEIEVDISLLSEKNSPKTEENDISMSPKKHNDDHGNKSSVVMFEIASMKINEKNVISRDQSQYDDNKISFVEEVLLYDKNISNEEKCTQIKEYVSPLEYIRDSRLINPNGIICPYQLRGQCDDKDCKFEHLPNDDCNKT